MHDKRIFISGGAGVIGTALVPLLLREGAHIWVGDLKPCPLEWKGKIRYRQGDLNTLTSDELASFNPEIVFHLAATFERSEESSLFFEENFHHNVQLSHHLIGCLQGSVALKQVIFASSYLIYNPTLYQFQQPSLTPILLKEDSLIYPRNICGAAKFFHELELRFLENFFKQEVTFISARIFRVYGRHSRDVISRWIRAALHDEKLMVYRSEGRFDYIFADDVAEGLMRLTKTTFRGVINLGSGYARSIQEVLEILKHYFPSLRIEEIPSTIPFECSQADMQQFEEVTGWRPPHTLEMAIPKLIQFERQKPYSGLEERSRSAVLITSISKKMPLIQAVRKAANKVGYFTRLYGSDSQENCIGQYGVDVFWQSPLLKDLHPEEVIHYCQQHAIQAIIPTRNDDLIFYAHHRESFSQQGIQVLVSSPDTIHCCLDKKLFADTLMQKGFPMISTALSLKEIDSLVYVVKERYGTGSIQLGLHLSREEALRHSQCLQNPIFQPQIEGKEWSVDLYRSRTGKVKGCVVRSRDIVVQGESQVTTTVSYPKLEDLCQKMADTLCLEGHAVFQVLEDAPGNFFVIECNPRFGGASTASLAVGLDSFYWFFLDCLGQDLEDYPFIRRRGEIRQIRHPVDQVIPWLSYSI